MIRLLIVVVCILLVFSFVPQFQFVPIYSCDQQRKMKADHHLQLQRAKSLPRGLLLNLVGMVGGSDVAAKTMAKKVKYIAI